MKTIPLTRGYVALVDDEDFEKVSKFKWHYMSIGYAARTIYLGGGRKHEKSFKLLLHRFLLSPAFNLDVDHINHNKLDNRKENLRVCTTSENSCNRRIGKTNKSGFKGVSWNSRSEKWYASIEANGKTKSLGNFADKIAAAEAYNDAAKRYFGEFALLNKV